ncbi:hypothetical protein Bbelb_089450 [Branchiostoma belcheri]|nr:hypothetical protein Bbelb_089450 [Branchiostoma belcheri]
MAVSERGHHRNVPGYADTFWFKYVLSVIAAGVAETVTYPLDLTKTRLQIQGELSKQSKHKYIQAAVWVRMSGSETTYWGGNQTDPFLKAVCGGLVAGSLGQFIASPTDLVKVQMQMEGRRILEGKPARVRGTWHAFTKILAEGGIRGLWKGWVPNVQRAALVNMGDLATYDSAKRFILGHTSLSDGPIVHSLSSACSGIVAASLGTPADVVKTRIMNQPTDSSGRGTLYRSSIDCLVKTVRKEGVMALYKGFVPIWSRMAPWSLTFWLSYEQVRRLSGTTSF